ncbi:hypothetical protein [Neoaquamicrobium sediminum]|uniref:hypothetical protein n=1 Tax=Neoaquamicrobium sediminum TaxID=1849104 RepID=UPI0015640393|nr:hypothetical protein [Mesorhizobium sediminum]NRC54136.1 hypothetical protein [Mesorhizobium sediminum]
MPVLILERDYLDIDRQNTSWELRNQNYTGWGNGEHLWNVDVNNNLTFASWWQWFGVHNRRQPWAPWNVMYRWYVTPGQDLYHAGGEGVTLPPFVGAKDYVWADRTYIGYSISGAWKPMGYVYPWRPMVEVSLFSSYPVAGETCCAYVVERAFSLTKWGPQGDARYSRFRSDRVDSGSRSMSFDVLVNGVKFGTATHNRPAGAPQTSRLRLDGPAVVGDTITFNVGDVISIVAPATIWGTRWACLSILGKVIVP